MEVGLKTRISKENFRKSQRRNNNKIKILASRQETWERGRINLRKMVDKERKNKKHIPRQEHGLVMCDSGGCPEVEKGL